MPKEPPLAAGSYRWASPGDVNAFFGLMLDNIADLLLAVGLLHVAFAFPTDFALGHMVPGTAVGVLVGDLLFFWMALRLARRTGKSDVTAMPLGLDTPSTIGMVLLVLGPAFKMKLGELGVADPRAGGPLVEQAAIYAWQVGACSIIISGVFKIGCAFISGWIRRLVPRAGLLGSLAAIALVLISFLPLIEVVHYPLVGLVALAVILTTLVARVRLPFHIPGTVGALAIGAALYYGMLWTGLLEAPDMGFAPHKALLPTGWLSAFSFGWLGALGDAVHYLPIVIPFALGTVVGGIDCTESAAAAGDDFDTRWIIGVEGVATLIAGLCGGVIQTTPYIGHPAYKAMGGRAAYTLVTALFVGSAGLLGYFGYLYWIIPKPTVFPILIFIGLEITAQSFQATPKRHYAAIALACVPALAALALIYIDKILGDAAGQGLDYQPSAALAEEFASVRTLANGFIVTSLIWASALAALIDRRLWTAAAWFGVAALFAFLGVIHSPLPGGQMLPWLEQPAALRVSAEYAAGYAVSALLLAAWAIWFRDEPRHEKLPAI